MTSPDIIFKIVPGAEWGPLVDPFYDENGWHTSKARDIDNFALAFAGNKIVGSVRFCFEDGVYMLRTMMIDPAFRKDGLGTRLLKYYESTLLKDVTEAVLCTPYDHLAKFYNIIGFESLPVDKAPQFLIDRITGYKEKGNPCL